MAKKKHPEIETTAVAETAYIAPEGAPAEATGGLTEEVHVFLAKRNELAQKLSQEIEATEKKLAELKRTAALLFPESGGVPPIEKEKEKPERKPKKSSSPKTPKSNGDSTNEDRPLLDQAIDPVPSEMAAEANGSAHQANGSPDGEQS